MNRNVLICGGGIAGLTLAILLKQRGFEPLVVERERALPTEGYMMGFYGTGWDVAERMGLIEEVRTIRYPIDALDFVDAEGRAYVTVPIERLQQRGFGGRYAYLRRTDLAGILYQRARAVGVEVRFDTTIESLLDRGDDVRVTFADGCDDRFALVIGADGIHSHVRALVFGPQRLYERFLGFYVAAIHIADRDYNIGRHFKLYEEPNRLVGLYPLDGRGLSATYVFRHTDFGHIPSQKRLAFVRRNYAGAGWLAERLLTDYPNSQPLYSDPAVQIVMPQWHKGRVALLGDACGCLTLLAAQGSHMAMGGAFVLAQLLASQGNDHRVAFMAYQQKFMPHIVRKQYDAGWFAELFVPTEGSRSWLRRAVTRLLLSAPLVRYSVTIAGATSVLGGWR